MLLDNLIDYFNYVFNYILQHWIWIFLYIIGLSIYLYKIYWYWKHANAADANIYISPISVKGSIARDLGAIEAGSLLRAQLHKINEIFSKERKGYTSLYMASALGDRFKGMEQILRLDHLSPEKNLQDLEKVTVLKELTIKVGPFQIPVGAIINFFLFFFRAIPILYRRRYLSRLIHVTLVSVKEETQVIVSRGCSGVLELVKPVKSLSDLNDLILDAAFMVLQLHGKVFSGRKAISMRYFSDAILALDEFKRTGNNEDLKEAEKKFSYSTTYDPANNEALYFYGSLLLIKRKPDSINAAIKMFEKANNTKDMILKGLVNSNLAICYAQKIHRLAERELKEQEKAFKYTGIAEKLLKSQASPFLKSWILSVRAQVLHANEGEKNNRPVKNFLKAATYYCKAIKYDKENGTLYNNLGWVMLKLSEWGKVKVSELDKPLKLISENTSELSETFLRQSLILNPNNKLSHSNLCLLYGNSFFRSDKDKNYNRCVFHGRKSIQIDKEYINGYRDLAVSLIRYEKLKEAYEYFEIALKLSAEIEKDHEIIDDVLKVLEEMEVPKEKWKEWQSPNPDLLLPPEKNLSKKPK